MSQIVLVDTSAWLAIYNQKDKYAREAAQFRKMHPTLLTTNFIIDEIITLVLNRAGYHAAVHTGEDLWSEKLAKIIYLTHADELAAWELFKKYNDKKFSFTDCTSFVVMLRLGLTTAFTFDDDFVQTNLFRRAP